VAVARAHGAFPRSRADVAAVGLTWREAIGGPDCGVPRPLRAFPSVHDVGRVEREREREKGLMGITGVL
jgi:hypothetical protein